MRFFIFFIILLVLLAISYFIYYSYFFIPDQSADEEVDEGVGVITNVTLIEKTETSIIPDQQESEEIDTGGPQEGDFFIHPSEDGSNQVEESGALP
ncbi:MAG: hypothetical protein OXU73_01295 [Candidatus Campbellbacteria bacterium]|nr:hypothetical protein [Candidatus Campbellbacteria bacterium]